MYSEAQLRAFMDALFAGAEARAAALPFGLGAPAVASIAALQNAADADFDTIYAKLQTDAVVSVDTFFDALSASFGGNTVAQLVIGIVKSLVDSQLAGLALQKLAA